jgi:hypothetical protein
MLEKISLFLWGLAHVVSWIMVILVDLESSSKNSIFFRHKSGMEGISRPFSLAGIDPHINVELKGMSKMVPFELIDRCSHRLTCILKKVLACFLTDSLKNNRAFPERLQTEHCY